MAWYPGATKMELQPESDAQAAIRPTQLIVHSIVAPWTARRTYEYWKNSTNLESHFGLGYEGDLAQYIGTETRADANYQANRRPDGTGAVSIETASNTSASDPWTPAQVEELIKLGVWLHEHHGIPLRICRTHSDPGFGYHRLHAQWAVSGTACPGDARVRQFREVVFPGIVARATGKTDPPQEDDEMPRYLSLGMTREFPLPPGKWTAVPWDVEHSDPLGQHAANSAHFATACQYNGVAYLRLRGVTPGVDVQARLVEDDASGKTVVEHPIVEGQGSEGSTFLALPMSGNVARDRRVKVQLIQYGEGPATVEKSYLKAQVWA